jgi:quinol monooxygenase YgiN
VLLVCRYRAHEGLERRARHAMELLTAQPGCLEATLARAVDDDRTWLLVVRFESVAAYRRALSPFPVREHVVPLLAEALTDEPATYEPLVTAAGGTAQEVPSLIAGDASTVRIGEAAGPVTPR